MNAFVPYLHDYYFIFKWLCTTRIQLQLHVRGSLLLLLSTISFKLLIKSDTKQKSIQGM